ncbi:hypothetical protein C4M97_00100 [Mycoplasmopsis pullorum]|uniref:BC85_0335 family putative methyltransferase n=1 Tax=Mycoplasmopsis pullorum TaxID=48003 RepID=UPI0011188134|nr:hypothetical protein [Mycoplasmopsis pullorum]TNK81816.1 hypothetical protein C4M94_02900 [Mycoplasmopsis pullorum]TNK83411.1 hypothetical protein C4M80_00375 [Mycoplasmopsis pullorum]TNK85066.1 hypothetical protein C4M81_00400 [Mycoplasmopsis pullorum]TNK85640.1 hypothetical protein C4M92_00685 [Mycoplasmopsis pullorum]TNK86130.1 hypothetical protein C4M85_01105 [Mycoplasmopsis pullorum]
MRTALTISIFVALIIGFGIYGILFYKAKKMQKDLVRKSEQETYHTLLKIRENIGEIPIQLKNALKSKTDDWDFEFNLNTIYLNNYQSILCISNDDLYVFAGLQEMSKRPFFYYESEFDFDKWNDLVTQDNPKLVSIKPLSYGNQKLDLVLVYGTKMDNLEVYKNFFNQLNHNGMLVINQKFQKRSELNQFLKYLNNEKVNYEIVWHKNKFLYISKK